MSVPQRPLFDAEEYRPVVNDAPDSSPPGKPRLRHAVRDQVLMHCQAVDELIPADHVARAIWEFVSGVDLSPLLLQIRAVEGKEGRDATDPRILLALWLYATVDGVGSARAVARLCEQHAAYRWICGGVSLNAHTLSDFRVSQQAFLDQLLTQSVATLLHAGVVELKRVAQDGMRVRAHAGSASFRRRPRLSDCLQQAKEQVERLRLELEADPGGTHDRRKAAASRAAKDRERRVQEALAELEKLESKKPASKRDAVRASTTDPQCRKMKMADGGFRPAYNTQYVTDTKSHVILGFDVINVGTDQGQMGPMYDQLRTRYGQRPEEYLVDGDFANLADIERLTRDGTRVYAPPRKPRNPDRPASAPVERDTPALKAWRERMADPATKRIYNERASTAEWVNAQARNHGLYQFLVRGLEKVRTIALWHALANNVTRMIALKQLAKS